MGGALHAASLTRQQLATCVVMLVWDNPRRNGRPTVTMDTPGAGVPPPMSSTILPLQGGGQRNVVAIRTATESIANGSFRITGPNEVVLTGGNAGSAAQDTTEFDPFALLDRLDGTGKVRLTRFLLDVCRGLFQIGTDPFFVLHMRQFVDALGPVHNRMVPRATVGRDLVLYECGLSDSLAPMQEAVVVSRHQVMRAACPPRNTKRPQRGNRTSCWMLMRRSATHAGNAIFIFGKGGFAVRRPHGPVDAVPAVFDWLASDDATEEAREYLLDALGSAAAGIPAAAMLAREVAAFSSTLRGTKKDRLPVSLSISRAVATSAGLFVSGCLRDPHDLVAAIGASGGGFTGERPVRTLAVLPGAAGLSEGVCFAALLTADDRAPRPGRFRFFARLHSGASVDCATHPALDVGPMARTAIVTSVGDAAATPGMIGSVIGPALDGIAAQNGQGAAPYSETAVFGDPPARPAMSLIVPFGHDPAIRLARTGALAAEFPRRDIEIIYTLDNPADQITAEHALARLWQVFGVPCRLISGPGNSQPSAARATAVDLAGSDTVLFLSAASVPGTAGCLAHLRARLMEELDIGACTGRVLNTDGSLKGAGIDLARTAQGGLGLERWVIGDSSANKALTPRDVLAASPSVIAVRRDAFRRAGGFADDYLTPDWQAADFGARVRGAGFRTCYVPSAVVTDFGHATGGAPATRVADMADAWRFARRWSDRTEEWTVATVVRPAMGNGAGSGPNSRWAA